MGIPFETKARKQQQKLKSDQSFFSLFAGSVADPGCLSRIPDPIFFHPGSRIKKSPGSGSASKNSIIF
jgi:hypothetical protein